MIEIRKVHDGYYIKVGDEILELNEDRILRRGDWKEPIPKSENRGETYGKVISKHSFHKLGDIIEERKDFDALADGSKISNGRILLRKENSRWYDTLYGNSLNECHPKGEWMVVINDGPN